MTTVFYLQNELQSELTSAKQASSTAWQESFIHPLAHFTFDKWPDICNTVTNAPIYSPNLNKCRLHWVLLLICARKCYAISFPFVCLLITLEQWSIVRLFPQSYLCACICTYRLSLVTGNFRNLCIYWGKKNQIHCKNRKPFSSSLKNKLVSTFWKECIRSTLQATLLQVVWVQLSQYSW